MIIETWYNFPESCPNSRVAGDLSEAGPVRPGRHVLAAAARAAQARADLGNRIARPQLGHQAGRFDHRIVAAAVAPAEHLDLRLGQIAELAGLEPPFLAVQLSAFDGRHDPSIDPSVQSRTYQEQSDGSTDPPGRFVSQFEILPNLCPERPLSSRFRLPYPQKETPSSGSSESRRPITDNTLSADH